MKVKILTTLLVLLVSSTAWAFDLATTITQTGDTVTLKSVGYAKLGLVKQETSLNGYIVSTGKLSVIGTANVVMWSKVEGRYYFTKLPALQKIKHTKKQMNFKIPFNAGDKKVTEVIIEVELMGQGHVSIQGFGVQNG